MNGVRAATAAAAFALTLAAPRSADAYCRTTTCGPGECSPDAACQYCLVGGQPLYWAGGCTSFTVNQIGSPLRGIDAAGVRTAITDAFSEWISVDCGGAPPAIDVYDFGLTSCGAPLFDESGPNASVWIFRDDTWPYPSSQLALTTVTFDIDTGRIYDADVELNSIENAFSLVDNAAEYDLRSIVVHEAGHVLGLAHSCTAGATMEPAFAPGDATLRTLEIDDANAICDAYPPGSRDPSCDPAPYNGLSTCGSAGGAAGVGGGSGSSGSGNGGTGQGAVGSTDSPASKGGCSCTLPGGDRDAPSSARLLALLAVATLSFRLRSRV